MAYKTIELNNSTAVYQQAAKTNHFYKGLTKVITEINN